MIRYILIDSAGRTKDVKVLTTQELAVAPYVRILPDRVICAAHTQEESNQLVEQIIQDCGMRINSVVFGGTMPIKWMFHLSHP
jgi:hypothetical protein